MTTFEKINNIAFASFFGVKYSLNTAKFRSKNLPNSEVLSTFVLKYELKMSKNHYLSRICDSELQYALAVMGAVLIEVKLENKQIDEAAVNLLKLREKINTDKMHEPSFLLILTGGQFAFRRKDGVFVVPIGCLKD